MVQFQHVLTKNIIIGRSISFKIELVYGTIRNGMKHYRAVVAELVRASILIDILSMLKVEGSNPGFADYYY